MKIEQTPIDGLLLITPARFGDHRGFFSESYSRDRMRDAGVGVEFVQDNHSLSHPVATVRGLHFQAPPRAQDKLVRCGRGALYDVAVDIRRSSPTYGQWYGVELSHENGKQLLVPKGFAHGFMTLMPDTEIIYKCSDSYAPDTEGSLKWDDPAIDINWPINGAEITLSDKDAAAPGLDGFKSPFA